MLEKKLHWANNKDAHTHTLAHKSHWKDKFLNLNSESEWIEFCSIPPSNDFHFRYKCFSISPGPNSIFKRFISTTFWFSRARSEYFTNRFGFSESKLGLGHHFLAVRVCVTMEYLLFKFLDCVSVALNHATGSFKSNQLSRPKTLAYT